VPLETKILFQNYPPIYTIIQHAKCTSPSTEEAIRTIMKSTLICQCRTIKVFLIAISDVMCLVQILDRR
jgi:hypothetical protein